jgi:hypothetical protein
VRQTDELSRVKARIKALTEKTIANGCTEAEAMAAAEMVGRLLERYALSMGDGCVPAIGRFCDCKGLAYPRYRPGSHAGCV